ncbi:MAG: DUF2232 domain-containing protein [Candidatus Zixiibacteriota bacterium]|nr:MAG: DUF2232 domain-containing protein [candidate division Zixibacteria bacterium]
MLDWSKVENLVSAAGLFSLLIFPIVSGIPGVGYVVQTAAMFSVIFFSYRRHFVFFTIGSLGSIVLASLLFGFSLVLAGLWAITVIPGAVFGRLLNAGISPPRTFVVAVLITIIISSMLFWGGRELFFQTLDGANQWVQSLLIVDGGGAGENIELVNAVASTIAVVKRLMPSLMALSGVGQLFIGWICLVLVLKGLGEFSPTFGEFVYWKMPDYYIFLFGLFLLFRLIGTELMRIVSDNFLLFLGFFYALFGFSVFEFYLKRIRLSLLLRVLFYAGLLLLQLPGLILAAAVGLFDSYFDFRKVKARLIG